MFEGCYTALITPFSGGSVDYGSFAHNIEFQIANGISGLVPCGTTGESATLTEDEHREVIEFTIRTAKGRVKVLAGTGSNCTETTVRLTRHAKAAGADGALLITPYYNKPTQEGLYQHYRTVAEACDIPIILYNVPGRTSINLLPETVARLAADCANIAGLKDATGSLAQASETIERAGSRPFDLLSGEDGVVLPLLSIGAKGVISVLSNIAPRSMADLVAAWNAGDIARARAIHVSHLDLCRSLFSETNPVPIKTAAAMLGYCREDLRLPMVPISQANRQKLIVSMKAFGLPLQGV